MTAPIRSHFPPTFPRLDAGPLCASDLDWWRVPIGGGVTHWCPDCAVGHVEDLLDAGAWTVDPDDAGECEPCSLARPGLTYGGPL